MNVPQPRQPAPTRGLACPAHGGPRVASCPWITTRDCGPADVALIVGGLPVAHLGRAEAAVLARELTARALVPGGAG